MSIQHSDPGKFSFHDQYPGKLTSHLERATRPGRAIIPVITVVLSLIMTIAAVLGPTSAWVNGFVSKPAPPTTSVANNIHDSPFSNIICPGGDVTINGDPQSLIDKAKKDAADFAKLYVQTKAPADLAKMRLAADTANKLRPSSDSDALTTLAAVEAERGRWLQAWTYADRAAELSPTNAVVLENAALILSKLGRLTEAEDFLRRAIECDRGAYWLRGKLASIQNQLGDHEGALISLIEAKELAAACGDYKKASAYAVPCEKLKELIRIEQSEMQ